MARHDKSDKAWAPKDQKLEKSDVDVDVTADLVGGALKWEIEIITNGHSDGKKVKLGKDKSYQIRFDLKNPHGLDVRFDCSGPIFVREGSGDFCPTKLDCPEVMIDSCSADELVIIDWNVKECEIHYQLNFTNSWGLPVDPCDPIILNGGGGSKPLI